MTSVVIYTYNSMPVGFRFKGHSGSPNCKSDFKGHNIVCAAVSTLAITAINAMESVAKVKPLTIANEEIPLIQTVIPFNISKQQRHDCEIILLTLKQGLLDIQQQHPNKVKLLEKQKDMGGN